MAKKRKIKNNKKAKKIKAPKFDWHLEEETKRGIFIIFLLAAALFLGLSILGIAGTVGNHLNNTLRESLGWDSIFLPLILLLISYVLFAPNKFNIKAFNYVGLVLFFLFFNALNHILYFRGADFDPERIGQAGGLVGLLVAEPFIRLLGFWGALVVIAALVIISALLVLNAYLKSLAWIYAWFKNILYKILSVFKPLAFLFRRQEDASREYDEEPMASEEAVSQPAELGFAKKIIRAKIDRPRPEPVEEILATPATRVRAKIDVPLNLLGLGGGKPTAGDIKTIQEIIKKTLANFGIEVEMGAVSIGPTVTQYTLKPAEGVKLAKITALHNDLALALAAHPIRIEAPIPGKSLVGIEVPNQTVATVRLREVLDSQEFKTRKNNLYIALGKDVAGRPNLADLSRMPHLLVAGATGSGKTVCLNAIIMSLLFENSPDELKFILIDPKRVELPIYNNLPHLITPVITDVQKTVNALRWAIREMERRFAVLSAGGARDIQSYNAKNKEKIPYIVVIIDELADLMAAAANEVESAVIRLAQMSRAVGIHLILATQRPSVDVITGLIKANIPARIAFAVASLTDSRTILDTSGAEKLLGRGDMLFTAAEISKPRRIQGAFVADEETRNVVEFIKGKYEPASYNIEVVEKSSSATVFGASEDGDPMLAEAIRVIFQAGKGSASLLQRRLKVGYARAARLLDLMEEQGIIGPADGAKPRELLISSLDELDNLGESDQGQPAATPASDEEAEEETQTKEEESAEDEEDEEVEVEIEEDEEEEEETNEEDGEGEEETEEAEEDSDRADNEDEDDDWGRRVTDE